ncbi:unnamed protein product [Schistosoma turkestanicum]|nr:unnamed protein product [Schistosoma turkestanicum]
MDMNFRQYCQPTNITTDIHDTNDGNQFTENRQREFDNSSTSVIVTNHADEHIPINITSSTISTSIINPTKTCNNNYDTNDNNIANKLPMCTNFSRNNTLNPIFNFWRNSTRRSGNWGSRTGTKKSFVWKYFFHPELHLGTKDLTHTQCILCDSLLAFNNSGTTTTMLNHLKSRHNEIVQQEYQQTKKSRSGFLSLREINKMTKLNYNLTSDKTKLIDWSNNLMTSSSSSSSSSTAAAAASSSSSSSLPMTSSYTNERNHPTLSSRRTHRGRPPGSYRYSDYTMLNHKFSHISHEKNDNINCLLNINNPNMNNNYGEKKDTVEDNQNLNPFQTQIKVHTSSPSYGFNNEKGTNSSDSLWSVPNMFPMFHNSQLFNTSLSLGNKELTNPNEAALSMVSSLNLNDQHKQNSNLTKDLFSELFTSYLSTSMNHLSNVQFNLSELTNLYMSELYKQINQQSLLSKNDQKIANQSNLTNCLNSLDLSSSNNTLKQQTFINENPVQYNKFHTNNTLSQYQNQFLHNSLPTTTNFSLKYHHQSLPFDSNEPLDLSLSTYKQKIEQEKMENISCVKSYHENSPVFINDPDKTNEDWCNNISAFTKVHHHHHTKESLSKSPDQSSNQSLMKKENLEISKNCTSTNATHNASVFCY